MAIVLDGSNLTIEFLVRIARCGERVELAPEALERIKVCRAMLEEKLAAARPCTAPIRASASSPSTC